MEQKQPIKILYVDDEMHNLESFKANYRRDYVVFTAISAIEAKKILSENEISVIITDQRMPDASGTQLLEHSVQQYPLQTRIMLTGYCDQDSIIDAINKGLIFKYLLKPYDPVILKNLIDQAHEVYYLKRIKEELYKEWCKTAEDLEKLKIKLKP